MDTIAELTNVTLEYPNFDDINFTLKKSLEKNLLKFGYVKPLINDSYRALENINLTINSGDRLGIIGLNGAGKTTLLRVLTGVFIPQFGEVRLNGTISSLIDIQIGFAHELTGFENIQRRLCIMGLPKHLWGDYIEDIIDFSDLGEFIYKPIATYSSGMQMRLAFTTATSVVPDLLILDEIIGAGDVKFREKADKRLKSYLGKSRAIVISSHDLNLISDFCNKCILLSDGKVIMEGPPDSCIDKYIKLNV